MHNRYGAVKLNPTDVVSQSPTAFTNPTHP